MINPFIALLLRKNQHTMASETRAAPATLVIVMLSGSVKGEPSNIETINDGIANNAKPVAPSKNDVTINNFFTDQPLVSIYRA